MTIAPLNNCFKKSKAFAPWVKRPSERFRAAADAVKNQRAILERRKHSKKVTA